MMSACDAGRVLVRLKMNHHKPLFLAPRSVFLLVRTLGLVKTSSGQQRSSSSSRKTDTSIAVCMRRMYRSCFGTAASDYCILQFRPNNFRSKSL